MLEISGTMFYLSTFFTAFFFGFPVGPSSLEMLRLSSTGRRAQAWMLAIGVAAADSVWALFALVGLLPWLRSNNPDRKSVFFLLAAGITSFLAFRAWSEKQGRGRKPRTQHGISKKRTFFWKGAMLGIIYPLTFGSWIVALAFLKNFGWRIPIGPPWIVLFFTIVFLGYFSYMAFLQFIFKRFQAKYSQKALGRWQNIPLWLMLSLSVVFLALALIEIFRFH